MSREEIKEEDDGAEISFEEAERIKSIFERTSGGGFYDRTDFKLWDVLEGLQSLYLETGQHDEVVDFARALHLSLLGLHPKFRLVIEHPKEATTFAPFAKQQRHLLAWTVADEIDVGVARGRKLESEVEAACAKHEVSRREAFRFLKEVREMRRQRIVWAEMNDWEVGDWELPEGFGVDRTGRIVPNVAEG